MICSRTKMLATGVYVIYVCSNCFIITAFKIECDDMIEREESKFQKRGIK
jgi:hypothetical protein